MLVIVAASVVVIAGAALLLLHTSPARRYVASQVTDVLQQRNIDLRTDELSYNLAEGRVTLRNLQVSSPDARDLPPFARVDRVDVDLSVRSLLRGRYVVESGSIEGADINYVVGEDGRDNLPRPPRDPNQPSQPLDYLIRDLQVRDATISYDNRAQDLALTLPVSSMSVEGQELADRHTVQLAAGDGQLRVQDRRVAIDSLRGTLDAGDDDVQFEEVIAEAEGARVEVSGTIDNFADPVADLEVHGTADAARLAAVAALEPQIGGTVQIDADIDGPLNAPDIRAHVEGRNLRYEELSNMQLAADATYDMQTSQLTFSGLNLRAPFGQVSGNGAVALQGDRASRIEASVSNLNAASLMRAFDLPYAVASRVDARVDAQWPGLEYLKANGSATVSLMPASRPRPGAIPVAGHIDVQAKGKTIDATLSNVSAASAEIDGRVQIVNQERLDGTLQVQVANAARAIAAAESVLGRPQGTLLPTRVAGAVRGELALGGTMSSPVVQAELAAPSLVVGTASDLTLQSELTYAPSQVTVRQLNVQWQQAALNASGTLALDGAQQMNFTFEADALPVSELLRSLEQGNIPASGTLSAHGRITGTAAQPAATATITGRELTAYDELWGTLTAEARLTGRDVVLGSLVLNKPQPDGDGRITATGTYHLDRESYTIDVDSSNLHLLNLTLPGGRELRGQVALTATGQGTLARPAGTLTLNGEALQLDRYEIGQLALRTLVADQQAMVDAALPTYGVTVDARIGVTSPYPATATIAINDLQLAQLPVQLDTPLEGQLAATVEAQANLAAPAEGTATARIQQFAGAWNGQPFRVQTPAVLRYADERLTIDQLRVLAQDATIVVSGEMPLDEGGAPGAIDVEADGSLRTLAQYAPAGTNVTASGQLRLDGTLRGSLNAIAPTVSLSIIDGSMTAPGGLTTEMSLEAKVAAPRADLEALEGRVSFDRLQVAFNGLTLAQQGASTIVLTDGTAAIQQFTLDGSVGTLTASGTVGLTEPRPLEVDLNGTLNVAAISAVTGAVRAEGQTTLNIAARGTAAAPELTGFVDLRDATFVVDEPLIAAEDVDARLDLSGQRITVTALNGLVNGGTLKGSGFVELGEGGIADASVRLTADDVANDFPLDLRSLSDITLQLARRDEVFVLDGKVVIDEAGLTGDINFDEGLLAAMTSRRPLDLTEERNPFLEQLRFNVAVETASPILVDNNLARAEVTTNLRVLGTPYEPGLSGRLTVLEEGEIILNERRYEVEEAVITFIGERQIIPSFNLALNTAASNYDITLTVTGTPGDTETSLTSDPALPEPDIMSLLVTGRTLEEMRGEEFEVAKEQVLSYLAGRVGSQLGRGLEEATGLSTVRIEPNLIANEADPTARLTVGQDITRRLELIYSVDLTNSNDQIWVAEYDITRRFQTSTTRQSDNTYRFDFRHDVRFGGRPAPERIPPSRPTVSRVAIDNDGVVPEAELARMFDIEPGETFDYFDARNSADEVRKALAARGYLQSRVRLRREGNDRDVALTLRVAAGPQVDLVFAGATPPEDIVDEVRTQWQRGVFDTQRLDDATEVLRGWLMADDYLQAEVSGEIADAGPQRRRVQFTMTPGTKFERVVLAFEGTGGIAPDVLDAIVEEQGLELELFTDPVQVTELLERYYGEQGYLAATVDEPRYEFAGTEARVVLAVTEGPRFLVRDMTVSGNQAIPAPELLSELPLQPGDPFLPFAAENALQQIRDLYWARGYNEMRPDYLVEIDRETGRLDLRFEIDEGKQSVVAEVAIEGNDRTSDRLVREQLELIEGQPLDLKALARSRSNLYDTRGFSLVDITREPLADADGQQPVRLKIAVREVQPLQLRYGASFDTERGLGGIADLSNHNSLGKARVIGIRGRYDAQLREARAYFNQPSLVYWPVESTVNVYYREEHNPETSRTGRLNIDRRGVSIQQERQLANSYLWSYGFRYEQAHSFDPIAGGFLDERVTVSPFNSAFTRETRDELLDATRGSFLSHAFEYSPSWLGTDLPYVRYFGQYFKYVPLQSPRRERFTGELLRPRLVFATGVRLGVARGLGGVVPLSERFFAGGSTTLRGFEQNAVGPIGDDGVPRGGNALFVLNNELRFPLVSIFDGVAFSDIGNVFPNVSDFSLTELRKTAGLGLRVRTPWFLLRGDYGFLLDRRAGERRGRFYFSIGQAF